MRWSFHSIFCQINNSPRCHVHKDIIFAMETANINRRTRRNGKRDYCEKIKPHTTFNNKRYVFELPRAMYGGMIEISALCANKLP